MKESSPPDVAARYQLLLTLSAALSGTYRSAELYRKVHEEVRRVMAVDGLFLSVYDEARDLAKVVFQVEGGEEREDPIVYRGSDSIVIRGGKALRNDDNLEEQALMTLGHPDTPVTRSALSVPLRHRGRVRGVLSVQSYASHAYAEDDLELLQAVGDLLALSVDSATELRAGEFRRRELERLHDIGCLLANTLHAGDVMEQVLQAAVELLQTDGATIWQVEEEWVRVGASAGEIGLPVGTRLPLEGELVRMTLEARQPVVVEDLQNTSLLPPSTRAQFRARTGVLVPLLAGDEVVGGLSVGTLAPRSFSGEEVQLLQRLANHGALALRNARLHEQLQALSLTDPLTQLPNRRHLELHIGREMAAARRGRNLAGVLFDLDDFKGYNDEHGHLAGDEVLRRVGVVLAEETRAMNLVARFGGDEFFAVLSDTTLSGADYHAQRVQERFARDSFLASRGITISFGAAGFDAEMAKPEELIQAADEALYRSKDRRGTGGTSPSDPPG